MAEKQFVIQQDYILPACFFEASYAFMNRKGIDAVELMKKKVAQTIIEFYNPF